jgi:hypothetical protein
MATAERALRPSFEDLQVMSGGSLASPSPISRAPAAGRPATISLTAPHALTVSTFNSSRENKTTAAHAADHFWPESPYVHFS